MGAVGTEYVIQFRAAYLLARLKPDKKHRMFIRCENRGKSMLISKLDACFCPCFPAALNVSD